MFELVSGWRVPLFLPHQIDEKTEILPNLNAVVLISVNSIDTKYVFKVDNKTMHPPNKNC